MNTDEKIKGVMAAVFEVQAEDIDDNASPDTIAKWDSLRHMNLIVSLEEEFEVTFDDDDIANMLNFKLLRLTIEQLTDQK
jgi:acyl carrier protein